MNKKPKIAITIGDPLGIGFEIVEKSVHQLSDLAHWHVIGEIPEKKISDVTAGKLSWDFLNEALELLKNKKVDALVTGPVSKTNLKKAGFAFVGQTEMIAASFNVEKPVMMLASSKLKVTLVTIHIPFQNILNELTADKILKTIRQTHLSLKNDFGIKNPKIGVCGLNPHAGENGLLGLEEIQIINPAIKSARNEKINVSDPLAADTIFYQAIHGKFDAVVCHYHDQGLIPLKTLSFDEGVNTTLGLPIIRTSPDHGPAFDIAGKNLANPSSMMAAMKMALEIFKNRKN